MLRLPTLEYHYIQNKYLDKYFNYDNFDEPFDPNTHIEPDGDSLLHSAAFTGDFISTLFLLQHGSNTEQEGDMSYTPLGYAAGGYSSLDTAILLIQKGSKLDRVCEFGVTPFDSFMENGIDLSNICHPECTIVKPLCSLDSEYIRYKLNTANALGSRENLSQALYQSLEQLDLASMYLLLKAGANPHLPVQCSNLDEASTPFELYKILVSWAACKPISLSGSRDAPPESDPKKVQALLDVLFWFKIFLKRQMWLKKDSPTS